MICEKKDCMGCFACFNICPQKCIKMVENEYGYIYPEIDKSNCINCGMCKKVCPEINSIDTNMPKEAYAMWIKSLEKRKMSTSGGAARAFSEVIIEDKGNVYGSCLKEGLNVEHICVNSLSEIDKISGSKYVHSYIENTYQKVKEDLLNDKIVLFVGTPCQVAGLRLYLGKGYDKLYTVDLICHGVPSQQFMHDQVRSLIGNLDADNIIFRDNNTYLFRIIKNNKVIAEQNRNDSAFVQAFDHNLILRENCYHCKFANIKRVADITIGDFWGIENNEKFNNQKDRGISLILINTEKGLALLKKCKKIYIEKRGLEEAINGNQHLTKPAKKNRNYKKFKLLYKKYGFVKAVNKALIIDKLIVKIKKILKQNKLIYNIYKKIK